MKIDVALLTEQMDLLKKDKEDVVKELKTLNRDSKGYEATDTFFKGATADASRNYMREVVLHIENKTRQNSKDFITYIEQVTDSSIEAFGHDGVIDVDYLENTFIRDVNDNIDELLWMLDETNEIIKKVRNHFIEDLPDIKTDDIHELRHYINREQIKVCDSVREWEYYWNDKQRPILEMNQEIQSMLQQAIAETGEIPSYQANSIIFLQEMPEVQRVTYEQLPQAFKDAIARGDVTIEDFQITEDGFIICTKEIGDTDWYVYCIQDEHGNFIFSVCKLRTEVPGSIGIAVSFIEIDETLLADALAGKITTDNYIEDYPAFDIAITAKDNAKGNSVLLSYFMNPHAQASYLIANLYVQKLLDTYCEDGVVNYDEIIVGYGKDGTVAYLKNELSEYQLQRLIELGIYNAETGEMNFSNIDKLSENEFNTLLCAFSGNASIYSFAAEVQAHALGAAFAEGMITGNELQLALGGSGNVLLTGIMTEILESGVIANAGVGENPDGVLGYIMDETFMRPDSYFTQIQYDIHNTWVSLSQGWRRNERRL